MALLTAFVLLVFLYSLVSQRLERTVITAPMLFAAAGAATTLLPIAAPELAPDRNAMLLVAELGLVMTLFTDASRIRPAFLKAGRNLPIRLLSTGMLLTIVLGAVLAVVVLGGLTWWEAGILAAILAPTDAGLGQVIVNSRRVPPRVRQSLNVEAPAGRRGSDRTAPEAGHGPLQFARAGEAIPEHPRDRLQPVQSAAPAGVGDVLLVPSGAGV